MHIILEFPPKVFVQWGAIAQEIVPYLVQRGVKRNEIPAILERLRTRWEQLDPVLPDTPDAGLLGGDRRRETVTQRGEESELDMSRHWKSQSARMLIESALADYQHHSRH